MFNRSVILQSLVPAHKGSPRRTSTNSQLSLAALLFALVLLPSSGWALVTNCPTEPKQGVPITSGQTYFGSSCILNTAADVDSFAFHASAGDVWSMATAMTTGGNPNNICLQLFAPGSTTPQFSGCSNTLFGVVAVVTNQTLTVAGTYSILVTETQNTVTDYGLSLERLNPTPPDGIPLALGQTDTSVLPAPTAQAAYTFFGTTTGIYKIASSMTSGGNPLNLCVALYQPNGTTALGPACTNSLFGVLSVSENFTPTQNGTYVVVIYEPVENATVNYNLSVSCISAPGTCGTPPPKCALTDALTYDATSGTLTMNFTVGTPVAATWNGWLSSQNTIQSLFSIAQPITEPPVPVTKTQSLAPSGKVGVLSTLTTPTGGITCSVWTLVNTGRP